jgi:malonate transporter and related proteins
MIAAFFALLPVFLTIVVGYGLRRTRLIAEDHWAAVDHLCYYVLFPAIMFKEIAGADFTGVPVWGMAFAMMLAIIAMSLVLFALRAPLQQAMRLDGPSFSSFFQGATRWHTFIALAIIPIYFGQGALALGGLAAAAMTPLLNVINVAVISYTARGEAPTLRELGRSFIRNPFIIATVGAILWRTFNLPMPDIAIKTLGIIGSGALGLALLAAGAGLRIDEALSAKAPVVAATALKLLAMPLLMAVFLTLFGVTGQAFAVAVLCGAVPTGSGAYVLARQMGGDAPLVANILTLQVICAVVTIPLVLGWFA